MSQIFHPISNTIARAVIFGGALFLALAILLAAEVYRSPWNTGVEYAREQPVPFSHEHHVSGLGLDCRYCHATVETSSFAGIPPTETCMTCHSKVWLDAQILAPVRDSWATGTPLVWQRVNRLPDFVYFDHSIHIDKGIGCATCHGPVDQMPITWKGQPLLMEWCLQCHREPEKFIRPRDRVFDMTWQPPPDQIDVGNRLVEQYQINRRQLTNCSVCHR